MLRKKKMFFNNHLKSKTHLRKQGLAGGTPWKKINDFQWNEKQNAVHESSSISWEIEPWMGNPTYDLLEYQPKI